MAAQGLGQAAAWAKQLLYPSTEDIEGHSGPGSLPEAGSGATTRLDPSEVRRHSVVYKTSPDGEGGCISLLLLGGSFPDEVARKIRRPVGHGTQAATSAHGAQHTKRAHEVRRARCRGPLWLKPGLIER